VVSADKTFVLQKLSPTWLRLYELIGDERVTELHFEGPQRCAVRTGGTLRGVPECSFESSEALLEFCNNLLEQCGTPERLDGSRFIVEAGYADRTTIARVHIIVPPVSPDIIVTIAKRSRRVLTLDELVDSETIDGSIRDLLIAAVAGRLNMIVAGGTGAGKTTILNALLTLLREDERIGIIEEVPEIVMHQPHVVSLYSRAVPSAVKTMPVETFLGAIAEWSERKSTTDQVLGDSEHSLDDFFTWLGTVTQKRFAGGRGEAITLSDLVRESVRMRFDRIVVGEVRGPEIVDLLSAMNTGLPGSYTTLHANSAEDVTQRVQLLAASHPAHFQPRYVSGLVASTIDLILFLSQPVAGQHRVLEVRAVDDRVTADGIVASEPIFRYMPGEGWVRQGHLPPKIRRKLAEYGFAGTF